MRASHSIAPWSSTPAVAPTIVLLMRMNCRSRPISDSIFLVISSGSQLFGDQRGHLGAMADDGGMDELQPPCIEPVLLGRIVPHARAKRGQHAGDHRAYPGIFAHRFAT